MQIPKHYKNNCFAKKTSNSTEVIVLQYPVHTKKDIFKKIFGKNKEDSKKVWEAINAIINNNKNTKKSRQISSYINNVITTDDKAIANHFNKFFTSTADKLTLSLPMTSILVTSILVIKGRIYRYHFKCNYLKNEILFATFFLQF